MATMLDEYIEELIKKKLAAAIAELQEPIVMLNGFEDKELLNVDDMCRIFNRTNLKAGREWIREAAKRRDLPSFRVGKDLFFHKRQVIALFLGEWRRDPKVEDKSTKRSGKSFEEMVEKLLED